MQNNSFDEKEFLRIKKLKSDFDNYLITEDEISEEDKILIDKLYDMQIKNIQSEIDELHKCIAEFKKKMQDAIAYLDGKKEEV